MCPLWRKVDGRRIWRGDWRVSHLFGSLVSCDHEVGENADVGGAHGVGEEADVGGGGQQTRVAEVTYMVWQLAVPLSDGCFNARRLLTESRRACVALLPSMRQLGYQKLCCACVDLGGQGWLVYA